MNRNFAALQAKLKEAEDAKIDQGQAQVGAVVSVGA